MFTASHTCHQAFLGAPKKQQGAVLVVALIILLVITLLGTSVLRTATLEERMAANTRDYDLAFQSAEAALRAGEDYIETLIGISAFSAACTDGLCTARTYSETKDRWRDPSYCGGDGIWKDGCSAHRTVTLDTDQQEQFSAAPKYIIEYFSEDKSEEDTLNMGNYGDSAGGGNMTIFRITALGYGGSENSRVMLQSMYGKRL